jgi:putative phosphoesterase
MKVAVISDIHENFHNLILALESIEQKQVDMIICLGDMMNAGVAKILAIQKVPVYLIWGNNDGEVVDTMRASYREGSNLKVGLSTYDFLELGDKKIFITHYDNLAVPMATSGLYDAVFYGHDHLQKLEKINNCFVVNPGEICAQKTGVSSYAIYDTNAHKIDVIELEQIITLKSDKVAEYFSTNKGKLNFRSIDSFKL